MTALELSMYERTAKMKRANNFSLDNIATRENRSICDVGAAVTATGLPLNNCSHCSYSSETCLRLIYLLIIPHTVSYLCNENTIAGHTLEYELHFQFTSKMLRRKHSFQTNLKWVCVSYSHITAAFYAAQLHSIDMVFFRLSVYILPFCCDLQVWFQILMW